MQRLKSPDEGAPRLAPGSRAARLAADSIAVGDAWVDNVRLDLAADEREATGGWPGTMREARARTYARFTNLDALERYGSLSRNELDDAVRAVYERARARWLACARADDDESR